MCQIFTWRKILFLSVVLMSVTRSTIRLPPPPPKHTISSTCPCVRCREQRAFTNCVMCFHKPLRVSHFTGRADQGDQTQTSQVADACLKNLLQHEAFSGGGYRHRTSHVLTFAQQHQDRCVREQCTGKPCKLKRGALQLSAMHIQHTRTTELQAGHPPRRLGGI